MRESVLDYEQQALVDLLRNELAELIEQDAIVGAINGDDHDRAALVELQQHVDSIGNAADLAGLYGLRDCCHHLGKNFGCLAVSDKVPDESCAAALEFWGIYLLGYLQSVGDDEAVSRTVADLLMFLADPVWPVPLTEEQAQLMRERFQASDLGVDCYSQPFLPDTVSEDMLSLAIGSDVRPELVQGLLTELPEQISQLEDSVHRYFASHDFSDLAIAQRLVHTIKGSANVVSVAGLANLTHHLEDLLEMAARTPGALGRRFNELLLDAVDCLAVMAESLAGMGPPPEDARVILTRLIDWIRQLRAGGPMHRAGSDEPPIVAGQTAFAVQGSANAPPLPDNERQTQRTLTIADGMAQELLRLAGETQITNTQAAAQIDELAASVKIAANYHRDIKALSGELEHLLETQGALAVASTHQVGDQMDPLELEGYNELHSFSHKLLELATDSQEAIGRMAQQIKNLKSLAFGQQQLNKDSRQLVLELRMVPVATLGSRFARCVRQACRLTGKSAHLSIEGDGVLMDSLVLHQVADPIMHLLRNAVDHGLETPEERLAVGKPAEGRVCLRFTQVGETIEIQCSDDGRGLDYERIAEVARQRRLVGENFPNDAANLRQLIMMPGFSTRDTVSQTSGRGIGLDVVATQVRNSKGSISLDSEPGQGCCFTLVVPTSILSGHALLVRTRGSTGDHTLCFVTRSIEQIIYLTPGDLLRENGRTWFELEEEKLPVFELNDLTQIHLRPSDFTGGALLLTRGADGRRSGVRVEAVLASQDLVIKPLGQFSCRPEGVVGATILGNGAVAPVVDLQELPGLGLESEEAATLRAQRVAAARELDAVREKPVALVVDDSLSARRSLAQFVADMGLEVRTARDGFEAISVIEQQRPVLMLVDLEMPRMNGLELTSHIRSKQATRDIPVIMITSRTTEKHRRLAASAGVNCYLSKPWSEDELMTLIQEQIA